MSYLPRMSKTYKEPPTPSQNEEEENLTTENTLQPASSLLNEATYNPQVALKHYKYLPHPPPVLPGPSVMEEAQENELFREASKHRRSMSKLEVSTFSKITIDVSSTNANETIIKEEKSNTESSPLLKQNQSRKAIKSKTSVARKKSSKIVLEKKKDYSGKPDDKTINMCLIGSTFSRPFSAVQNKGTDKNESNKDFQKSTSSQKSELRREKSAVPLTISDIPDEFQKPIKKSTLEFFLDEKHSEIKPKDVLNRSVQCTIFGSVDKIVVISPVVISLLRALAFLLHELSKEDVMNIGSGEKKRLMTQIQLILGDLCNQNFEEDFTFDMTYSDSKRIEKIYTELQKYLKELYGTKGEFMNKFEDVKRVFVELKKKEMELTVLSDKLKEKEMMQITEEREIDLKNPEITLQNKRLESEQLLAEVEFSGRELKKYQKSLADIDWEIKNYQEQLSNLKKSIMSKSKTEIPGKKISTHKISESQSKGNKSKNNEDVRKKKTL